MPVTKVKYSVEDTRIDGAQAKDRLVIEIWTNGSLKPEEGARVANQIQKYLIENTRLGIPALVHEECCSGYMARNATCFPQIIGIAIV